MEKLIFIDACMRQGSRTRLIADALLAQLATRYEIETISIVDTTYPTVNNAILTQRSQGYVPEEYVQMARRIAQASRLVIAAPFWDMSFPSALKVFIENMSLFGVTFSSTDTHCHGLCQCQRVLYITTRGMDIPTGHPLEQATPYIKAISHLWGLGEVITVAAQNIDYSTPEQIDQRIAQAIAQGSQICQDF